MANICIIKKDKHRKLTIKRKQNKIYKFDCYNIIIQER